MKKIISFSVVIILFWVVFSSEVGAELKKGDFEKILKLDTFVIEMEGDFPKIESHNFKNIQVQNRYQELRRYDAILRDALKKTYQNGDISEFLMQDILSSYANFIYYTNKAFLYHEIEEQTGRTPETVQALKNSYETMRSYYAQVKVAVSKR